MTKKLFTLIILSISMLAFVGCGGDNNDDPSQKKDNKTETKDDNKCGNGTIDTGEECDGTNLNGKTCENVDGNTYTGGTLSCSTECKFVKTSCTQGTQGGATCNNNTIEGSEVCDGTALGGKTSCSDVDPKYKEGAGTLTCKNDCTGYDVSQCELKEGEGEQIDYNDCTKSWKFYGQVGSSKAPGGGVPKMGEFKESAGLNKLDFDTTKAGWTQVGNNSNVLKLDLTTAVEIEGAVVTAIDFAPKGKAPNFFIQDKDAALKIYFSRNQAPKGELLETLTKLKVGDKINFKVKQLTKYFETKQITSLEELSVASSNADVYIKDLNTAAPTVDGINQLVTMQGTLGNPEADTGQKNGETVTYGYYYTLTSKLGDQSILIYFSSKATGGGYGTGKADGKCVAFTGPLSTHKKGLRLDGSNFDWYRDAKK